MSQNPLRGLSEYEVRHLVAQLAEAGRINDVHRLLGLEYRPEEGSLARPSNAWYAAKTAMQTSQAYLADVRRAWELAEKAADQQWHSGEVPVALGFEARYALLTASVHSLVANLPYQLVVALVRHKVWSNERGLANARGYLDASERADALLGLLPFLSGETREQVIEEAQAAAQMISNEAGRPVRVARIAVQHAEPERTVRLQQALQLARAETEPSWRPQALAEVAYFFPEPERTQLYKEALDSTRLTSPDDRGYGIGAALVPVLKELRRAFRTQLESSPGSGDASSSIPEHLLDQALSIARTVSSEEEDFRADAIAGLAPYLTDRLRRLALTEAAHFYDKRWTTRIRAAFEPYLLEEAEVRQNLAVGRYGEWEQRAQSAFSDRLTPQVVNEEALLDETTLIQALEESANTRSIKGRKDQIARLAPYLPASLLPQALAVLQPINDGNSRAIAGAAYVSHLEEPSLSDALDKALAGIFADDGTDRYRALGTLAPHLTPALWAQVIPYLQSAEEFDYWSIRDFLAPHIPVERWNDFIHYVAALEDPHERTHGLLTLAPFHPDPLFMLQELRRCDIDEQEVMIALAGQLPADYHDKILQAIWNLEKYYEKEEALSALAPRLAPPLLKDVFDVLCRNPSASLLAKLAPFLPKQLIPQAVKLAQSLLKGYWGNITALVSLLPRLAEPRRSRTLLALLKDARGINDYWGRMGALEEIIPALALVSGDSRNLALQQAREQLRALGGEEPDSSHVRCWAALAPFLEGQEQFDTAREVLEQIGNLSTDDRGTILEHLMPALSPSLFGESLRLIRTWDSSSYAPQRSQDLTILVPWLIKLPHDELFPLWRNHAKGLFDDQREQTCLLLAALAPVMLELGGTTACRATALALLETGIWWP